MTDQKEKARNFASLHQPGTPVILVNFWDPATGLCAQRAGATAIATGSHSVAGSLGYKDGEACPLSSILPILERTCEIVSIPVSHDLERGYGQTPSDVAASCQSVMKTGVVGVNIEDSLADGSLRAISDQCDRLSAAREAMDKIVANATLNARCDVFFQRNDLAKEDKLDAVLERTHVYQAHGASSLFVPGLTDMPTIKALCEASPLPINIMRSMDGPAITDLATAGVARVSHGPFPFMAMLSAFEDMARTLYGTSTVKT